LGNNAAASVYGSAAIGSGTVANSQAGFAVGEYASTKDLQRFAYTSGRFAVAGDAQMSDMCIRRATTDATPTVLTSSGNTPTTNNILRPSNNSALVVDVHVVGREAATGDMASFKGTLTVKRGANAASASVSGSLSSVVADSGASTWTAAASADTTLGGLIITVTGQASKAIKWVAALRIVEVVG